MIKHIARMFQSNITNALKAKLILRLKKELDRLDFDYTSDELELLVNAVLEVIGEVTQDGIDVGKGVIADMNKRKVIYRRVKR